MCLLSNNRWLSYAGLPICVLSFVVGEGPREDLPPPTTWSSVVMLNEEQFSVYLHGYGVTEIPRSLDGKRRPFGEATGLTVQSNSMNSNIELHGSLLLTLFD